MSNVVHHWIVVTSWSTPMIEAAHIAASGLGNAVTAIFAAKVNGYRSFCVLPDGSKEGWAESDDGDRARARFVAWLDQQRHEDGSSWLDWAEVALDPASDGDAVAVVRHAYQRGETRRSVE